MTEDKERLRAKPLGAPIQRPLDSSQLGEAVEFFRFGDFRGWIIEG